MKKHKASCPFRCSLVKEVCHQQRATSPDRRIWYLWWHSRTNMPLIESCYYHGAIPLHQPYHQQFEQLAQAFNGTKNRGTNTTGCRNSFCWDCLEFANLSQKHFLHGPWLTMIPPRLSLWVIVRHPNVTAERALREKPLEPINSDQGIFKNILITAGQLGSACQGRHHGFTYAEGSLLFPYRSWKRNTRLLV